MYTEAREVIFPYVAAVSVDLGQTVEVFVLDCSENPMGGFCHTGSYRTRKEMLQLLNHLPDII